MSVQSWVQTLVAAQTAGPTLTAAAAATALPTSARGIIPAGALNTVGAKMRLTASGSISCVVTTPGTARYDLRLGATGTIVVFDTLAMPLNIVGKTNVGWWLDVIMTVRTVGGGTSATLFPQGKWQSEAFIGSPLATVGGNGSIMVPFNTAPAAGAGFDSTIANTIDFFFTQTVATGSMTVQQFSLALLN